MPSLTQLVIAGSALALACAPVATEACMHGFAPTKKELAVLSVVAVVTSPLWIVPAIGAGIVIGTKEAAEKIKESLEPDRDFNTQLVGGRGDYWRRRTEQIRPYFEEAEKNPTPLALFRLGMHLIAAEDFVTGRRFLRRSIDLAKQAKPDAWDSATENLRLLPLLALAHQQSGEIAMRLHHFSEAYDYFIEAKRLVDNLNKLSPVEKEKANQQANINKEDNDDNTNTTTFTVLGDANINHDIAWALLHMTLYGVAEDATSKEEKSDVNKMVATATEMLKESRSVSAEYDLHYCIAMFYQRAFTYQEGRPSAADDGDDDPIAINWKNDYYTQAVPEFVNKFRSDILPLFIDVIKRLQDEDLCTPEYLDNLGGRNIWGTANLYLARCYYVLGERNLAAQAMTVAKKMLIRGSGKISDDTVFNSLGYNLKYADDHCAKEEGDNSDRSPAELQFYRVEYALTVHQLNDPEFTCGHEPHSWVEKKFHRPSWCQKCQQFITWSENRAGCFQCSACGYRCHKKCKEELGTDAICKLGGDNRLMGDHQHVMRKRTLHRPHYSGMCNKVIKNFFAAYACESCGLLVHEDCKEVMRNVLTAAEKK